MLYSVSDVRRFWSKTRRDESGCVLWTEGLFTDGYGQFWQGDRPWPASRWIVQAHAGRTLAENEWVLHSCDVRTCVNLAHLRIGTAQDNSEDAVSRQRLYAQQKTHCPREHPYGGNNLYVNPKGHRYCRECRKLKAQYLTKQRGKHD